MEYHGEISDDVLVRVLECWRREAWGIGVCRYHSERMIDKSIVG